MELYLLDSNFDIVTMPIDDFSSFVRETMSNDIGTFSLSLSKKYAENIPDAAYVYDNDSGYAGKIKKVEFSAEEQYGLGFSGESLIGILSRRIIHETFRPGTRNIEAAVLSTVQKYAVDGEKAVKHLEILPAMGYNDTGDITGEVGLSLTSWLFNRLPKYHMVPRIELDIDAKKLLFSIYRGVNRTTEQSEANWVIFSESFENIQHTAYHSDFGDYRNFSYCAMENDSFYGRVSVELDAVPPGEERYEMYIASSVSSEAQYYQNPETGEEYQVPRHTLEECKAMMLEEAREKLLEKTKEKTESVTGQFVESASYEYGKDFFVGDTVSFQSVELGLSFDAEVTSCTEIFENGTRQLEMTVGQNLTNVSKLKKLLRG